MITEAPTNNRELKNMSLNADLVVVGGGLSGTCCAITAARQGIKVILIQDRPVLGGNASSEIRLWMLGATSHMGNNNRWAREGGVVNELVVENTWRNPEGNPVLVDTILLEKVIEEPNIQLLLNTAVDAVEKADDDPDRIIAVSGFCSQNATRYTCHAPLFCDASGDGIVGFLAGAAFRMGAEKVAEFGEGFAPGPEYGELLGHSIYFYSRDTGRPVQFHAPSYALKDIKKIPRYRQLRTGVAGCSLWWLEYGGTLDTIHDSESIKWELWRIAYGVWDYIKNSGEFPDAENLTLEWVGTIPGKRESRRFEGDVMLTQQDIVEQRRHPDAVAYGGWAVDVHPADGVYSEKPGCSQWHSRGVYQIPFRCLYSRNINNLFLAGRIISASHVAFASTRVMMTCAHAAQAAGMAAALCRENRELPRELTAPERMAELQLRLQRTGQHIPHVNLRDPVDLAAEATITASSEYVLSALPPSEESVSLDFHRALLIPAETGRFPRTTLFFSMEHGSDRPAVAGPSGPRRQAISGQSKEDALPEKATKLQETEVEIQLRGSEREGNFTPDTTLAVSTVRVRPGKHMPVTVDFDVKLDRAQYVFLCVMSRDGVEVSLTAERVSGVLSLVHRGNKKVANRAVQTPPEGIGFDTFEFWLPQRRPQGNLLAATFEPPIAAFGKSQLASGYTRPFMTTNTWVTAKDDPEPTLSLTWDSPQTIRRVVIDFDVDYDHPMESVQYGHPERAMPFCVRDFQLRDEQGTIIHQTTDNHQGQVCIDLAEPCTTRELRLELTATHGCPAAVCRVCVY
ncbi:MAG: FAD-dependent oxidoreductase [Lentisphaeria bacterium]|nr:FAD-dependent oxidoreductase [Lentisphaeria bacterium]